MPRPHTPSEDPDDATLRAVLAGETATGDRPAGQGLSAGTRDPISPAVRARLAAGAPLPADVEEASRGYAAALRAAGGRFSGQQTDPSAQVPLPAESSAVESQPGVTALSAGLPRPGTAPLASEEPAAPSGAAPGWSRLRAPEDDATAADRPGPAAVGDLTGTPVPPAQVVLPEPSEAEGTARRSPWLTVLWVALALALLVLAVVLFFTLT
ncbi:hypothetical protein [Micrococcus sp.]|uniref:hypothetical protein n=1 Tax=Micrococcus sp. TaxID=1271 RepID=UPI002A91259C|nr:hypothetical protein [Micrococcus sp.]MDY6054608.1 hypothetical protein [Micrococcus sp.]